MAEHADLDIRVLDDDYAWAGASINRIFAQPSFQIAWIVINKGREPHLTTAPTLPPTRLWRKETQPMVIPEKPANIVVVGAGILGAAIAWRLGRRGVNITLIDRGQAGHGASSHSFAWITAGA